MAYFFIVVLIVHLGLCCVSFFFIKRGFLQVTALLFPVVVMTPVVGLILLCAAEYLHRKKQAGTKSLGSIYSFTLDEDDYRRITMKQDWGIGAVVPVEEAISINDAKTRRQFMMDIANRKEEEYTPLLQKARLHDDVEVAHYASTAIMELLRGYEINIQKCRANYEREPEDTAALDSLIQAYRAYITSGLVEDQVLDFQRERYAGVLEKRMKLEGAGCSLYCDAADNQIERGQLEDARRILDETIKRWPNREAVWKIRLKLCRAQGDRECIEDTIRAIRESGIFLSTEFRESLAFWMGEGRK